MYNSKKYVSLGYLYFIPAAVWRLCFHFARPLRGDHHGGKGDSGAHRPRRNRSGRQLRAGPHRPGAVQRSRRGTVQPAQTQVQWGGTQAAAHDQKGQEGVCPWRAEGKTWICMSVLVIFANCFPYCIFKGQEVSGGFDWVAADCSGFRFLLNICKNRTQHLFL